MTDSDALFFKGLQALSEATFPKKCANCGKIYESAEAFFKETQNLQNNRGLKQGCDEDGKPVVELFRNCACGSTLMDFFGDRRDTSEAGLKRRVLFERMLSGLIQKGVDQTLARAELLKIVRGQPSQLLEEMGFNTRKR